MLAVYITDRNWSSDAWSLESMVLRSAYGLNFAIEEVESCSSCKQPVTVQSEGNSLSCWTHKIIPKINKMEPTNPNANTYSKTNTQTIFDNLVGDTFVGHSCRTHSFRKPLWDTLVHSCGTPCMTLTLLGHSCVGHFCMSLLWDTLVGHSCRTLLWGTLAEHSCRTLLWDTPIFLYWGTLAEHSCGTLLWGTLVGHS